MSGLQNITTLVALATGTLNINVARNPASLALFTSTDVRINGTAILTGNLNISPSGTPIKNTAIKILWEASVTLSGNSVVIFGETVPDELASRNFVAECVYDGVAWVVNILPDFAGVGIIGEDRLAASSVTTAKIADNAVTLAKMAGLAKGKIIYGDASGDPADIELGSADGRMLLGDTTNGVAAVDMSGDATISKTGALTIASNAVTTAKILDANVTPAKMSAGARKASIAIPVSFETAGEIGVVKYTMCFDCTVDAIHATVTKAAATDTATAIFKDHGGTVLTGSQVDITTGLFLGNIVSTTPTANNTFTAGEQITIETSKTTPGSGNCTVILCLTHD
jgi:hypothetical protein